MRVALFLSFFVSIALSSISTVEELKQQLDRHISVAEAELNAKRIQYVGDELMSTLMVDVIGQGHGKRIELKEELAPRSFCSWWDSVGFGSRIKCKQVLCSVQFGQLPPCYTWEIDFIPKSE